MYLRRRDCPNPLRRYPPRTTRPCGRSHEQSTYSVSTIPHTPASPAHLRRHYTRTVCASNQVAQTLSTCLPVQLGPHVHVHVASHARACLPRKKNKRQDWVRTITSPSERMRLERSHSSGCFEQCIQRFAELLGEIVGPESEPRKPAEMYVKDGCHVHVQQLLSRNESILVEVPRLI